MHLVVLAGTALLGLAPQGRDVGQLRAFYAQHCVRCHGVDGSARDVAGRKLKGKDFTDAKEMAEVTDADLESRIRKGLFFGRAMPAFGKELNPEEIRLLVKEVVRKAQKGKPLGPVN